MIVVSGCPRSGTSLMMKILRTALGEDAILGSQFPQEKHQEAMRRKLPRETDAQHAYRMYALALDPVKDVDGSKDMNPDGFWECAFTVRGVRYHAEMEQLLEELLAAGEGRVCKIVSQGLARSDPRFVDKVILMARSPREVAKSQERLKRKLEFKFPDGKVRDMFEGRTVHSPEMFIEVTLSVLHWLSEHPKVAVLVVPYDELLAAPGETVQKVAEFVGASLPEMWASGAAEVKQSLHRSHPEDKPSRLWDDAERVYQLLLKLDYEGAKEFVLDPERETHKENRKWMCVRAEQPAVAALCRSCLSTALKNQLRQHAEKNGVPWQERPCAYEVAYGPEPLISIEESVRNNSWTEVENGEVAKTA